MSDIADPIDVHGIAVPLSEGTLPDRTERQLQRGRYQRGEVEAIRNLVRAGDRVLDIGAGLGLLTVAAALVDGVETVTSVEADPVVLPMLNEALATNGVADRVTVVEALVTAKGTAKSDFYLREDILASSSDPEFGPYTDKVKVSSAPINPLLKREKPDVIISSTDENQPDFWEAADLSGVRHVILKLFPKRYGEDAVRRIVDAFSAQGLRFNPSNVAGSNLMIFDRIDRSLLRAEGQLMPVRAYKAWPVKSPKITIVTCMKDEGPFILEWIAWHRAVGVTDFVVFTNDCSDGTAEILDRLEEMGIVRHLPNPAVTSQSTAFQPAALRYFHYLPEMMHSDFVISMDVDEFINVRVGDGTLAALFEATGAFDALSISEINHGSNKNVDFERGWLKDLFPAHETETPGGRKARRGVKTIVRLSERVDQIRNHRPDLHMARGTPRWIDGSGRDIRNLPADPTENGIDVRGSYDLVALDHFALRSVASYLVKMYRGDVVVKDKRVSERYWRVRNRNDETTSSFERLNAAARAEHAKLEKDTALMALHDEACEAHEARVRFLDSLPDFADRKRWIFDNAWD